MARFLGATPFGSAARRATPKATPPDPDTPKVTWRQRPVEEDKTSWQDPSPLFQFLSNINEIQEKERRKVEEYFKVETKVEEKKKEEKETEETEEGAERSKEGKKTQEGEGCS